MKAPGVVAAVTDVAGIAGAVLFSWGVWQVYRPAGYIAAGVLLMAAAWLAARSTAASPSATLE